ncbi:MAG: Ig-like domain-containing protein [Candidatus Woesearchaeota archaeon]|nr:Ig-like domain-containing protein [Candidatus Woesearchaeota archaeon]
MKMKNNKIKIAMLVFFAAAFITLLAEFTLPQAQQTCYNSNAGSRICTDAALADCCPTPEADYPYYYSAATGYGPSAYSDCQSNYYSSTQPYSEISQCTTLGCCCPGGTSYVVEAECPIIAAQTFTAYDGRTCTDVCATPPPPPLPTGTCNDVTYTQPPNVTVTYPKGELGMQLNFYAGCTVSQYTISRCTTNSCASYTQIATTPNNFYIDSDVLWDTNYTYKIVADYALSGASGPRYLNATTGNIECWHKLSDKFCLHNSSYLEFKDYLIDRGFSSASDNLFLLDVKTRYSSRFNNAYDCDDSNMLVGPDPPCSSTYADVCVADGATASCLKAGQCSNVSANPYAIFFGRSLCEGITSPKYCFYDKSPSITDYCYDCNPSMLCYDYKSESACESNNCNVGSCQWTDTIDEIGIGVCVDLDKSNCELCNLEGTSAASNLQAYNEIFDICTSQKSGALSTPNYPCYTNGSVAISCNVMTCLNYSETECGDQHITLDASNTITTRSPDNCSIGVCELNLNGACHKNADNNYTQDCLDDDAVCEADYFKPTTTIVPVKDIDNSYKYLDIQIYDQTSKSDYSRRVSASDYRTYLCHYGSDEADCIVAQHPYTNSTTQLKFYINDYTVFTYDGATQAFLFELTNDGDSATQDNNIIKYYTEDPAHNLGIVQNILITPVPTPPHVLNLSITDGTEVNEIIYTKSALPAITTLFDEPATIILSKINSSAADIIFNTYSSDSITYTFIPTAALSEGVYTFSVRAKDDFDTAMPTTFTKTFIVDTTPPTITVLNPINGNYSAASTTSITINFSEKVFLDDVTVNTISLNTSQFSSTDSKLFTKSQQFSDGQKTLIITAHDYAGNAVSSTTTFTINALPLNITMLRPRFGFASTLTFDVIVNTDDVAACKYYLDSNLTYSNMNNFTSSNGFNHTVTGFSQISDLNKHFLYVRCNDNYYPEVSKALNLTVINQSPTITANYAAPDPVVEIPPNITLFVETYFDPTLCKYSSTTSDYASMEGKFPGYDEESFNTMHNATIELSAAAQVYTYTYYVACEGYSGLPSTTAPITFSVDLSKALNITDYTVNYTSALSGKINITTNKKSECLLGTTLDNIISSLSTIDHYRHTASVTLSQGPNLYYIKCASGGTWTPVYTLTIVADPTLPVMSYVDDSADITGLTNISLAEYAWKTDELRVKWNASEDFTWVTLYQYTLKNNNTAQTIINWTDTTDLSDDWRAITGLTLVPGNKYYFTAKAKNYVGLWSTVMGSNGIIIDPSKFPEHCTDGIENYGETDIDCGGSCDSCTENKNCTSNADCSSSFCNPASNTCQLPTCSDTYQNDNETDVDCGGNICNAEGKYCSRNKKCLVDADCSPADICSNTSNRCIWNGNSGPNIVKLVLGIKNISTSELNNLQYINIPAPNIKIDFDSSSILTEAKIEGINTSIVFPTTTAPAQNFTLSFIGNLSNGNYTLTIYAKYTNGIPMTEPKVIRFIVDTVLPTITLQSPLNGAYSNQSNLSMRFNFSEAVILDDVLVDAVSLIPATFTTSDNKLFTKSQNFSDGSKTLIITAHDYAGSVVQSISTFEVDAVPLTITMLYPPYNVSPTPRFNITIGTDKAVQCRQSLDISVQSFNNMAGFDISNSTLHELYNLYITDENTHNFYVKCNDTQRGIMSQTFVIRVDSSLPQIITAYANPSLIVEAPPNATLKVQTNEAAICKYSNATQNYSQMEGNFSSYTQKQFDTIHNKILYLPTEERSYTYYAACENLAGWTSATSTISFVVNLSAPTAITIYSPTYSNTNQTKIDIGTNKNSECYWGMSSSSIIYSFSETTGYRHKHTPNQQEGSNTYYAKCIAAGVWSDPVTITFVVDTNKPNMSYVDDSSNLANNTQFSYFTDRLQAKWHGTDVGSGIWYYMYLLEDSYLNVVVNWTASSIDDQWYWLTKDNEPNWAQTNGTKLNLTNLRSYKFKVKAVDYANWTSDIKASDGVTVDILKLPSHCVDLLFESDTETDVDCGKQCIGCTNSKNCLINSDCLSGYCPNSTKKCTTPSCSDNVQNGDETDKDCGGSCPDCTEGKKCIQTSDCATSLKCKSGICKKDLDNCKDAKLSGDETDIDCGGGCDSCDSGKNCLDNSDCITNYCSPSKKCITQTCSDNIKNSDETDKDCGGAACSKCQVGKVCLISRDCTTNYCLNGYCNERVNVTAVCGNGFKDAGEECDDGNTASGDGCSASCRLEAEGGGFNWFPILLTLIILAALSGGGYAFYAYYYAPYLQKKKPYYAPRMQQPISLSRPEAKPGFIQRPAQPVQRSREIKRAAEAKEREKIFKSFDEEKPLEKIVEKPAEKMKEEIKEKSEIKKEIKPEITEMKEEAKTAPEAAKPSDIFARLRKLAEKPKGTLEKEIKKPVKSKKAAKPSKKDDAFRRLKEIAAKNLKGDYAKKLLALTESKGMAKQDLSKTFSNLFKTKKITKNLAEEILLQLMKLDKITKSDAKFLLSDLAGQKLISEEQAKKILSNLDAE